MRDVPRLLEIDLPSTSSARPGPPGTKARGDASEAFVQAHPLALGACVLKPFGDSQRFDLVVYHRERFHRVQVKTARLVNGALVVNLYSQSRAGRRTYDRDVDFICAWSPELGRVYILRPDPATDVHAGRTGTLQHRIALRVHASRNGQTAGTRRAEDYELRSLAPFEA